MNAGATKKRVVRCRDDPLYVTGCVRLAQADEGTVDVTNRRGVVLNLVPVAFLRKVGIGCAKGCFAEACAGCACAGAHIDRVEAVGNGYLGRRTRRGRRCGGSGG